MFYVKRIIATIKGWLSHTKNYGYLSAMMEGADKGGYIVLLYAAKKLSYKAMQDSLTAGR